MKTCGKCGETKELSEFYRAKGYKDGHRRQCKECFCVATNQYCKDNKEQYLEYGRKYRRTDPEKGRDRDRKWWANRTPEQIVKCAQQHNDYRKANLGKFRKYAMDRKASKLQATPSWASQAYIELWYKAAVIEQERTSKKVHVDHIIPLQGNNVCGLHCEDNMQLLFASDNLKKYNSNCEGHC